MLSLPSPHRACVVDGGKGVVIRQVPSITSAKECPMRVRHFVHSAATTTGVIFVFAAAAGMASAARPIVELESTDEGDTAQALCPLVQKTLEAFAASPAAQKPICDWRPLQFAEAGGLTRPDWQPAGGYVDSDGFARKFMVGWLDVLVKNGGKPVDRWWSESGYERVLSDSRAKPSWQEATFAVDGDRRPKRWLRLDIAECRRYPQTFVHNNTLPKLAVITGSDVPSMVNGQMLGTAFSSDDVLLHDGSAYDLALNALPRDQGAAVRVHPLHLTQLDPRSDERTLLTHAPLCYFKIRKGT